MKRLCGLILLLAGCGGDGDGGVTVHMDFDRSADFYAAPFPSEDLRGAGGTIDLAGFPNPEETTLVSEAVRLLGGASGFAQSGGVFFQLSAPADPARLPDLAGSVDPGARVFLIGVTPTSPDYQRRYPVYVRYTADGYPYGPLHMLSLVPLQGVPLRPRARYAAVVMRDLAVPRLGQPRALRDLIAGDRPAKLSERAFMVYRDALTALAEAGVPAADIAALAAFETGDPLAETEEFREDILARPRPMPTRPFARTDVFDDYCVYASAIQLPDYQSGTPPYESSGGAWTRDPDYRKPVVARMADANLFVTLPRRAAPPGGFPTVLFVRTGGGGDRPLVDRGRHGTPGGAALVPGSGPAQVFARAGWAGISVDGPHGGVRNITQRDEQFLVFNVFNPSALRDNIRESAIELALMAHIIPELRIDATDCPDLAAAGIKLDITNLTLMGHSTGAWIGGLTVAIEPRYRAAIFSGFGGSWIENVMYKQMPLNVAPVLRVLLSENELHGGDPALSLIQWAAESADPQVYARRVVLEPKTGEQPRHVLMEQGIVDHYILPRIANSVSLGLGLDLAGPPGDLDVGVPDQTSLSQLLRFSGASNIGLPASRNKNGVTAVVVQHPGDGLEDGHEMVFQTDPPKRDIRCFLLSLLAGTPRVPGPGTGEICD